MNAETIEQLANRYQASPVIRALAQVTPISSAVDAALVAKLENIHKDKLREFFDELEKGAVQLTPEIIKSEDFLHCYFSTTRAALNTRRREKIRYFARLLTSSINSSEISTVDEYEECLSILDELGFRELGILVVLSRYEKEYPYNDRECEIERGELQQVNPVWDQVSSEIAGVNEFHRVDRFWDQFSSEICSRFSIPDGELEGILTRLNRTGLYDTIVGTHYGYTGGRGRLTPLYIKLEKLIRPDEDEF